MHPDNFFAEFHDEPQLQGRAWPEPFREITDFHLDCRGETAPYRGCMLSDKLSDGRDYSVNWEGLLMVPADGDYTFTLADVDDGAQLFVDGTLIVDKGWNYPRSDDLPSPQTIPLTAGPHDIAINYEQRPPYIASLQVRWSGPGFADEVIPWFDSLYSGCKLVDELADGIDYSVTWEGRIMAPVGGEYRFTLANVDDGAQIFIDGQPIADKGWNWPAPDDLPSPQIKFLTKGWHNIRINYEQRIYYIASLQVRWAGPGFTEEVIPLYEPPPQETPDAVSPTDWTGVMSLRPTFKWKQVLGAESYTLNIYRARGDRGSFIRVGAPRSVDLSPAQIDCRLGVCSFKPRFPHPESPNPRRFELTSQLSPPVDPMTQPPQIDDRLFGYVWLVQALVHGKTVSGRQGEFVIPPLGLWKDPTGVCKDVYDFICPYPRELNWGDYRYCKPSVGYEGGYWNLFDDSFYRWAEIFDVPPELLKAITVGETLSGLGPRFIHKRGAEDRWYSPTRAYLYEPGRDYGNRWECKEDCRNFLISEGHSPDPQPYDFQIQPGISIRDFRYRYWGITYIAGFQSIPGCDPDAEDPPLCRENTNRPAEYAVMASYGLGQVLYYSAWPTLRNVALGKLPPPEKLYGEEPEKARDADFAVRAMASFLGFDKRCRTLKSSPQHEYPRANSPFDVWRNTVWKYNARPEYAPLVKGRLEYTQACAPSGRQFELGQSGAMENLVRDLAGLERYCNTNDEDFVKTVSSYLEELGVPVPPKPPPRPPLFANRVQSANAAALQTNAAAGEREVSSVEVDLRGDGSPVFVTLSLVGFETVGKAGVIRVFDDDTRQTLLWQSEPIATNVLDSAFTTPIFNPATGRLMLLTEWFEGFHSSRTYLLQWDGAGFGLIPTRGEDGGELDGIFSDGGGVHVFGDGSLLSDQRDYVSYEHRIVDVYRFDGAAYRKVRRFFVDDAIVDTAPPNTSVNTQPPPGPSGWQRSPILVILTAVDEHDVRSISYTVKSGDTSSSETSPLDRMELHLDEGRWSLTYYAHDVYHNRESERQFHALVDTTPPQTEIVLQGESNPRGKFVSPVEVGLTATDPVLADTSTGSGVARTEFSLDNGLNWQVYTEPFVVSAPGTTLVQYRSVDVAGNVEPASLATITINSAPVAEDDLYRIDPDGMLRVAPPGVMANDHDVDADPLTATLVSNPSGGRLTLNPDGSFAYIHDPAFGWTDSFTYGVNDGYLDSEVATVSLIPPLDCEELYGIDAEEDALVLIDPATGAGQVVGPLGLRVQTAGLDFDRKGRLWGFSPMEDDPTVGILYEVDLETGRAREIQRFDMTSFPNGVGMEFGPDGKTLFAVSGSDLFILDVEDGDVIPLAHLPFSGESLTLPGRCHELLSFDSADGRLMRVSTSDGAVEEVGPSGLDHGIDALAVSPDGRVYGHGEGRLYIFDVGSGEAILVGDVGFITSGLAFRPPYGSSMCLDAGFDRKTRLSKTVTKINKKVRHVGKCHFDDVCERHGRKSCKVCKPKKKKEKEHKEGKEKKHKKDKDKCGKCGEGGYYQMGKGGVMSLRTAALPLDGIYRIQFQVRSSKGKETRLRVWTGEDRFEIEIRHESWRWTEPILVSLGAGVNTIHLANGGRRRVDIEGVRIERDCPGPSENMRLGLAGACGGSDQR